MQIRRWRGEKIAEPGLYSGIPIDEYHKQICAGPSVSSSGLRRVLEINGGSPAHFYNEWSGNPAMVPPSEREKEHFIVGRAAHHLMLGQENFHKTFAVRPDEFDSWRTKAAQGWREDMEGLGYTVLTPDIIADIRGMATSLSRHPLVHIPILNKHGQVVDYHGLLNGKIEVSGFWRDEETGLWIKIRPDAIPTESGDYADLKTTTDVHLPNLTKTVSDCAYHQQAALVAEGGLICAGIEFSTFRFVFVEKKSPYSPRVIKVHDAAMALGQEQNHSAMRLIARCLKEDHWPGPGDVLMVDEIALSERYRNAAYELLAQEKTAAQQAHGAYENV